MINFTEKFQKKINVLTAKYVNLLNIGLQILMSTIDGCLAYWIEDYPNRG